MAAEVAQTSSQRGYQNSWRVPLRKNSQPRSVDPRRAKAVPTAERAATFRVGKDSTDGGASSHIGLSDTIDTTVRFTTALLNCGGVVLSPADLSRSCRG